MLVLPTDHAIDDNSNAFAQAVADATKAARAGYLVAIGIVPQNHETGERYIQAGA